MCQRMSTSLTPTSTTFGTSADPGHYRHVNQADGWIGVFALPMPPFSLVLPVAQWALLKRDGGERMEGLVPFYAPSLHLASMLPMGAELIDYLYLPLAANTEYMKRIGYDPLEELTKAAIQRGQQLASLSTAPNLTLVGDDDES